MKIGIALSGGGIRGIAHAGVLKALEDNNIKPDIIGGTSCGSMVSVMYAMGYSPYHIFYLFKKYANIVKKINAGPVVSGLNSFILNKKFAISGLNSGEKIEELGNIISIRKNITNINQIKMPIVIPTVDLVTGKECICTNNKPHFNKNKKNKYNKKVYITDIGIGTAVRASSSFPRIFFTMSI